MSPTRVEPEPQQPVPLRQSSSVSEASSLSDRRRSSVVAGLSDAPPQLHRGASPAFMAWLLEELAGRDAKVNIDSISTHDLTMGAVWSQKRHKKRGYGYGPPTTQACIRAFTMEAETSVYAFITSVYASENEGNQDEISWKHKAAQPLRDKLARRFGNDWLKKCFGTATHFVSHAWECSFAGLIEAITGLPSGAFVWCDVITINQHHAATEERSADLRSLGEVIKHAGKVHLYVEPLQKAKAIQRLWVLYELATNWDAHGELSLGFSKNGRADLMGIARDLATEFESDASNRDGVGLRATKARRHPHPHHPHPHHAHPHHPHPHHPHPHHPHPRLLRPPRLLPPFSTRSAATFLRRPSMPASTTSSRTAPRPASRRTRSASRSSSKHARVAMRPSTS